MDFSQRHHTDVMRAEQQSTFPETAFWRLVPGEARRLTIGPGPRWLQVASGRVWLTTTGGGAAMEQDRWLLAGDTARLATGTEVVLEAWGQEARFELLVPPQACTRPGSSGMAWLHRLAAALRRARMPGRAYLAA